MKIRDLRLAVVPACLVAVIALQGFFMDDRGNSAKIAALEAEVTDHAWQADGTDIVKTPVKQSLGLTEDQHRAANTVIDIETVVTGNIEVTVSNVNADKPIPPTKAFVGRVSAIDSPADSAIVKGNIKDSDAKDFAIDADDAAIEVAAPAHYSYSSGLLALNASVNDGRSFSKAKAPQTGRLNSGLDTNSRIGAKPSTSDMLVLSDAASAPEKSVNSAKPGLGNATEAAPESTLAGTTPITEVTKGSVDGDTKPTELPDLPADGPENTSPDVYGMAGNIETANVIDPQTVAVNEVGDLTKTAGLLASNTEKAADLNAQPEENAEETTTPPGTMLYPFSEDYSELVAAEYLTRQQFLDHAGETFWLYANQLDPPIELVLRRVVKGSGKAFTLRFRTRDMQSLPQMTFKVDHDTLGAMALFVTSTKNARGRRTLYNAIINKEPTN